MLFRLALIGKESLLARLGRIGGGQEFGFSLHAQRIFGLLL
jgi:hypothetical protein